MNTKSRICGSIILLLSVMSWTGCANDSAQGIFPTARIADSDGLAASPTPHSRLTIWHESYDAATQQARSEGKLVLADFTGSDWCGWCVKLKQDVFSKPEFQAWARENVVLLELDYPRNKSQTPQILAQNKMLKDRYNINSFPTILLLDPDGNVQGKMAYSQGDNPAKWIARVEKQTQRANSQFVAQEGSNTKLR